MTIWLPVLVLLVPVTTLVLRSPGIITKIGPDPFIGIRSAETLRDKAAWRTAHQQAWPYARTASLVFIVILLAVIAGASFITGNLQAHIVGWGTAGGLVLWFSLNLIGTRAGLSALQRLDEA